MERAGEGDGEEGLSLAGQLRPRQGFVSVASKSWTEPKKKNATKEDKEKERERERKTIETPQMVAKNEWIWIETYDPGIKLWEEDESSQETNDKQVNPDELDL